MIKVRYKVLYKNGIEDEIIQEGTEEELKHINEMIEQYLTDESEGSLTFGDTVSKGYYIRLIDVYRVSVELL